MKSIPYEGYRGPRLPRDMQLERVRRVMQEELTPLQREALVAFYFHEQTITEIAAQRVSTKAPSAGRSTGRSRSCAAT